MRLRPLASVVPLLLFSILASLAAPARAEDTLADEYDETARVVRVTLVKGEVSLLRDGEEEWESARPNLPLVEGDTLATGRDSHAEIQIDSRNFVRLGHDSVLKIATLREEGVALSLSEGTATVRLARFDGGREYFELDAPRTTVAFERTGLYRVDAYADGGVRVAARDDGRARVYSENSGFTLRGDRAARFYHSGGGEGDWELTSAPAADLWDSWVGERERYLAARLRHEGRERYYDPEVWGAEELDVYGDWSYTREYGYVWRPHVTVVNHYHDWAPYRYGHWRWRPPYGWTWVPDEDWGWAPYHYGRWVYVGNAWCWAPRGYGYAYHRARWRPALVAFVNINIGGGHHVAWYPLAHGQRDPRGRHWRRGRDRDHDRLRPLRADDAGRLTRANPALLRAVTSLPAREFGSAGVRARQAAGEVARRALISEPLGGSLPIVPARLAGPRVDGRERRAGGVETPGGSPRTRDGGNRPNADDSDGSRLVVVRPETVRPSRVVALRPTGATARTPGVALDQQLRRTRVFNNREPRVAAPAPDIGSPGDEGGAGTGAVARPPRTRRERPVTPSADTPTEETAPRRRPERPDAEDERPRRDAEETPRPPRARRPTRTDDEAETPAPRERPARPSGVPTGPPAERREPPAERREPRVVRPVEPDERPQPPPRRVEPRDEPPASEQPRPPVRTDPPRREPPPQREPRPREEAPRQAPPREEAPRQQPPRVHTPPPRQESPAPSAPPERNTPRVRPAERPERERPQEERDQR